MSDNAKKAYKNLEFLSSPAARHVRILCEYEEPRMRLLDQGVHDTIVFFGSARAKAPEDAAATLVAAEAHAATNPSDADAAAQLERARLGINLADYYVAARVLAERLTQWNVDRAGPRDYTVCTGGGPGMMEAANRGAADVEGGRSVGLGISLPFEEGVNAWVPKELAFEFHYFFMRKLWFLYLMKAMAVFPGGFGTLDEFFETLTLIQTGKIKKKVPMVLFGTSYWNAVFNPEAMAAFGTISPGDTDLFLRTDDLDEAFEYIVAGLLEAEASL